MREIKLRVRDLSNYQIIAYELFNVNFNSGYGYYYADDKETIMHSEYSDSPMPISKSNTFTPIQRELCTGLADKDGIELYENDLVFVDGIHGYDTEELGCFCVRWSEEESRLIIENEKASVGFEYLSTGDLSKVGDYYLNPELLEAK